MTEQKSIELPRLIQRLNPPVGRDNPFAFGGGYKNGGLNDDAMDLLRGIFSFDYMGAAEFEFGAVPEAMQVLADRQSELRAYQVDVVNGTVYVLCFEEHRDSVAEHVEHLASEDYPQRLKEPAHLKRALTKGDDEDWFRTVGWLALGSNPFMFFTDLDMWTKTCNLFGVEV